MTKILRDCGFEEIDEPTKANSVFLMPNPREITPIQAREIERRFPGTLFEEDEMEAGWNDEKDQFETVKILRIRP